MKVLRLVIGIILGATLLTACDRTDLVQWSPDGKRVAVLASDGLRLGDETGKLSRPALPNVNPTICRWLPDSTHALLVWGKPTTRWLDVKPLLSQGEQKQVTRVAASMWIYRGVPGKWKSPDESLDSEAEVYLAYKYGSKPVRSMLARRFEVHKTPCVVLDTLAVADLSADKPEVGPVLWSTTKTVDEVRISPRGKLAAVAVSSELFHQIWIVSLQRGATKMLDDCAAQQPDWSADGKTVFYVALPQELSSLMASKDTSGSKPDHKKSDSQHDGGVISIGTLAGREIADADGNCLPRFGSPYNLAYLEDCDFTKLRCLPDGGIVFNGVALQLPCAKKPEAKGGFFRLSADGHSVSQIVTSGGALGDLLGDFEINQDGTKIVVAGSKGEVTVLDLASGKVTALEKAGPEPLKFDPQWRSKDELCFPARNLNKAPGQHDVEVALQSLDGCPNRIISKDWPAAAVSFLMDATKEPGNGSSPKVPKGKKSLPRAKK